MEEVRLRVSTLRTQVTVSAGLFIAFGIVLSLISGRSDPQAEGLLIAAFALLAASAVFALIYMHHLASSIAENSEWPYQRTVGGLEGVYHASTLIGIGGGVVFFLLFLLQNIS
jgi:hypothetical protein